MRITNRGVKILCLRKFFHRSSLLLQRMFCSTFQYLSWLVLVKNFYKKKCSIHPLLCLYCLAYYKVQFFYTDFRNNFYDQDSSLGLFLAIEENFLPNHCKFFMQVSGMILWINISCSHVKRPSSVWSNRGMNYGCKLGKSFSYFNFGPPPGTFCHHVRNKSFVSRGLPFTNIFFCLIGMECPPVKIRRNMNYEWMKFSHVLKRISA